MLYIRSSGEGETAFESLRRAGTGASEAFSPRLDLDFKATAAPRVAPVLAVAYEDVDPNCRGCQVRATQLKATLDGLFGHDFGLFEL